MNARAGSVVARNAMKIERGFVEVLAYNFEAFEQEDEAGKEELVVSG
jgi:hypothetical protein